MDIPKYLYHYTNIDSLALILKNKTIRLNSLDRMDDRQEQETADIKNLGQFIYVSSWAEEEKESIPMWIMYTNMEAGVRIKLRSNPFRRCKTNADNIEQLGFHVIKETDLELDTFLPFNDMMEKGYYAVEGFKGEILKKIEYTNDPSLLYPKINYSEDKHLKLDFGILGRYKNLHWEFQKEWRYIMTIFPFVFGNPEDMLSQFTLTANKIYHGLEKQVFSYYDLHIDEEAYAQMEVTLSPKITAGNRELIMNTILRYNPQIKVNDSSLLGLI